MTRLLWFSKWALVRDLFNSEPKLETNSMMGREDLVAHPPVRRKIILGLIRAAILCIRLKCEVEKGCVLVN